MEVEVLYEDNHLLVINKPFGYLVHPDKTGDESLEEYVKKYIKKKYNKPGRVFANPVHRLDRPVTGVLVFARTSKAFERLAKQFSERKVDKTYWCLTEKYPEPPFGTIKSFLTKDRQRNYVRSSKKAGKESKEAITHYRMIGKGEPYYLLELKPVTGRSHQLRAHMKSLGAPILGDLKYGGATAKNKRAILLHCHKLIFEHPVKKEKMELVAKLPRLQAWQTVKHLLDR